MYLGSLLFTQRPRKRLLRGWEKNSSCSCLAFLPSPAWVLPSKICKNFPGSLYYALYPNNIGYIVLHICMQCVKDPSSSSARPPGHIQLWALLSLTGRVIAEQRREAETERGRACG